MKRLVCTIAGIAGASAWLACAETKVDFTKDIQPILEQNCFKCHGPEKQKGKMRLDSKESALKGGKTGAAIVPGKADQSEMVRRISLPKTDDDFMPSEGEPLAKAQIDLIRDWINQGAEWPEPAAAKATSVAPSGPALPADFKPGPNETKAIADLSKSGVDVRPIAMNVPWREANFRLQSTNITDAVIAPLKDLASLVDLNLAATKITDAGLAHLHGLTNLMRLHLELTGITDAGLPQLKGLQNLTYLNLYGTQVTDAGLDQLRGLKHLRSLYVWQTKVSDAGAKQFKEALPHVDVVLGWDAAALAKKEEQKEEKPEARKEEKKEAKKEAKPEAKKEEKKEDKAAAKKDETKEGKKEEKKDN